MPRGMYCKVDAQKASSNSSLTIMLTFGLLPLEKLWNLLSPQLSPLYFSKDGFGIK